VPADQAPAGPAVPIDAPRKATGFNGLSNYDQAHAGTGAYANSQGDLEPPDQALCVSDRYVVEAVNTALAVRSKTGKVLAGPVPLNQFFKLAPQFDPNTGLYGDFTSDPKCYYDADSDRFFVTMLQITLDPATGGFMANSRSSVMIAVTKGGNPTGKWNIYRFDVTNDGMN